MKENMQLYGGYDNGLTHGTPYRDHVYVPLRFGGGDTFLLEWEHNNNDATISLELRLMKLILLLKGS